MSIQDLGILTDEYISSEILEFLRQLGFDVLDVKEERWMGKSEMDLLNIAQVRNRIVVTHDSDFGKIVFTNVVPFVGIVYLRPGHFSPKVTEHSVHAILQSPLNLQPPFILVVENTGATIKLRYREVR